jgi:hypothetical protein
MTAEELALMGYQPSMGSPNLTEATANVSPEDLQQFYAMPAGAESSAPSLTPDQVDPALLAQLMGTPAPQAQMDQVSANQLAMLGVPPPSDPNGLTTGPDTQALGPDGRSLNLPPNTGADNTYGGAPAPQQAAAPAQPAQSGGPGFYQWAKENYGLERGQQITIQEKLKLLDLHNDYQKELLKQQDPEKLLKLKKDQVELQKSSMEQVDNAFKMDEALTDVQSRVDFLDKLKTHPGLSAMVGAKGLSTGFMGIAVPGTEAANFNADLKRVQGQNFLTAFQQLKGAGQITEIEGKKATDAISSMSTSQSEEEFKKSIDELQGLLRTGMERTRKHYASLPSPARAAVGSISQSPSASPAPAPSSAARPATLNLKGVVYQLGADGTYHRAR